MPCQYVAQKKSWLNSQIFEDWVRKLDRKFHVHERNNFLIIGNGPAHPSIFNLTNIQLNFFLPNTTSIIQPMDQSVIRILKGHYRGRVVTKGTVVNYFRATIADSDDQFKDLQEHLIELKSADPSMVPEDVTAESIVSVDDDVIATIPEIAESDILKELCLCQQTEVEEEENNDDDENSIEESFDQSQEKPSRLKVESALDVLKDAALYSDKGDEIQIFKFEKLYCTEQLNSDKRT